MKQRINKSLPYPLLSIDTDDYVGSTFTHSIEAGRIGDNLTVTFSATLTDTTIEELISEGKAKVVYHLECTQTGYRKVFYSDLSSFTKSISFSNLRGVLDINTFIIATQDIKNYRSDNFNEDYDGLYFDLEAGCRIAEAPIYSLEIPKKYTDFKEKNDPYVIVIPNKDMPDQKEAIVDLSGPKILMIVPQGSSSRYSVLQQTPAIRPLLHDMYILPALFQGLLYLKSLDDIGLEDARGRLWVQSIEDELKESYHIKLEELQGKELVDLYTMAQQLLNYPLVTGTDYLASQSGGHSNED